MSVKQYLFSCASAVKVIQANVRVSTSVTGAVLTHYQEEAHLVYSSRHQHTACLCLFVVSRDD